MVQLPQPTDWLNGLSEAEAQQRIAARRALSRRQELIELAAARIKAAAEKMILRDRARRSRLAHPYVLPIGARVQVSYQLSPVVRAALKTGFNAHVSPTYTAETYAVTGRRLAEGSRRVVVYDLLSEAEGERGQARINNMFIRLSTSLRGVDRRLLRVVPEEGVDACYATRYPGGAAFRLFS